MLTIQRSWNHCKLNIVSTIIVAVRILNKAGIIVNWRLCRLFSGSAELESLQIEDCLNYNGSFSHTQQGWNHCKLVTMSPIQRSWKHCKFKTVSTIMVASRIPNKAGIIVNWRLCQLFSEAGIIAN